ncbi:MAG TPA: hypothetical protein VGO97_05900 [Solirubrobacterales bacterium]|jgi:L-alanine-DL-glutamate epimerase-like enolase superfamily enzyme|nr:hypothetical protein [Solirubrobacterales bacterium]
MSLYDAVKDLPLKIDGYELVRHELAVSSGFDRVTTEFVLSGSGQTGRGEDVIYDTEDHDALQQSQDELPLRFEGTFGEFSERLAGVDLFPQPPLREPSVNYRRWAVESAALDLALRQAGKTFDQVIAIQPRPVRFILSLRLGDPPSAERVDNWLAVAPWLEFKLDAETSWSRELIEQLAASGRVESIDLKGLYEGTLVDNPPDARLYRDVVELFPTAWIEDAKINDETWPVLEPAVDRLTWDAPLHSVADIEALEHAPKCINVKPSRFGPVSELLAVVDYCRERGIEMYSGGQFELSIGRQQLHALASVFFPESANDASPVEYHAPHPAAGVPASPLKPPATRRGFGWHD